MSILHISSTAARRIAKLAARRRRSTQEILDAALAAGIAYEERSVTLEALVQKLKGMVPELLDANGVEFKDEVTFEPLAHRFEVAPPAA